MGQLSLVVLSHIFQNGSRSPTFVAPGTGAPMNLFQNGPGFFFFSRYYLVCPTILFQMRNPLLFPDVPSGWASPCPNSSFCRPLEEGPELGTGAAFSESELGRFSVMCE